MKKKLTIKEDIHFKVLWLIEEKPAISQRELAKKLNISLGAVNFCIKALIEVGHIKIQNFEKNPNKLNYLYLLTHRGNEKKAKLTDSFLKRKIIEFNLLKNEIQLLTKIEIPLK